MEYGCFSLNRESNIMINIKTQTVVPIGKRDFLVLDMLIANVDSVVTKQELLNYAWKDVLVSQASLTQSVATIRKLIGDNGVEQKYIKTIPGVGYMLVSTTKGTKLSKETMDIKFILLFFLLLLFLVSFFI